MFNMSKKCFHWGTAVILFIIDTSCVVGCNLQESLDSTAGNPHQKHDVNPVTKKEVQNSGEKSSTATQQTETDSIAVSDRRRINASKLNYGDLDTSVSSSKRLTSNKKNKLSIKDAQVALAGMLVDMKDPEGARILLSAKPEVLKTGGVQIGRWRCNLTEQSFVSYDLTPFLSKTYGRFVFNSGKWTAVYTGGLTLHSRDLIPP